MFPIFWQSASALTGFACEGGSQKAGLAITFEKPPRAAFRKASNRQGVLYLTARRELGGCLQAVAPGLGHGGTVVGQGQRCPAHVVGVQDLLLIAARLLPGAQGQRHRRRREGDAVLPARATRVMQRSGSTTSGLQRTSAINSSVEQHWQCGMCWGY